MSNLDKNKKHKLSATELRQKAIYFQSEAAKYKFLAEKYELLLSQALRSKEITGEPETEPTKGGIISCTSYFNYSFIQEKEEKPFIYGSFIIKNNGTTSLNSPIICLKVNQPELVNIGGKIGELNNSDDKLLNSFETWSYLHDDWQEKWFNQGELWLKPKQTLHINPEEKLSFSGFDIHFKTNRSLKPITIDGFCYCREFPNGVKSLNSISITI